MIAPKKILHRKALARSKRLGKGQHKTELGSVAKTENDLSDIF